MGSTLGDINRFGAKLQRELERIDQHHDRDVPHVRTFVQRADGQVKESSLMLYLQNLRVVACCTTGALVETDRDVWDRLQFGWRRGAFDVADGTVRNYQTALRRFLGTIDREYPWLDDVTLVQPGDTTVSPADMLRADDIRALCDAAMNHRDIALIEFLADTGARIGLTMSLRVGDVNLDAECPTYVPNAQARGLKGAPIRDYPLIDSRATLRTYRDRVHPRPERDDVAFFHAIPGHGRDALEGDGSVATETVRGQLSAIADRAGVDKPTNPHNFRHSAISRMRREGFDRAEVEKRVCWTVDSDMWQVYEHIAAEEANRAMFERAGVVEPDTADDAERRRCGTCLEVVAPHHPRCPRCGIPVDESLAELTTQAEAQGTAEMAVTEDRLERLVQRAVLDMLRGDDFHLDPSGADAAVLEAAGVDVGGAGAD